MASKPASYFDRVYKEKIIGHPLAMVMIERWARAVGPLLTCCENVLDLGCGLGVVSAWAKRDYIGVDFSKEAVKYARANYERDGVAFTVADLFRYAASVESDSVCAVILSIVLQHLDDPASAVAEAKRIAKYQVIAAVPMDSPNVSHVKPQWTPDDLVELFGSTVKIDVRTPGYWLAVWRKNDEAIADLAAGSADTEASEAEGPKGSEEAVEDEQPASRDDE